MIEGKKKIINYYGFFKVFIYITFILKWPQLVAMIDLFSS